MIEKFNVPINTISWINLPDVNMGFAKKVVYPETIEELVGLSRTLYTSDKRIYVLGHTSNSYFESTFRSDLLIITNQLNGYTINDDCILCECGAPIKQIAKEAVKLGLENYAGLCDLPGTVGAAVYGNAGCYGCEMGDIVMSVEVLQPDGKIRIYHNNEINFQRRSSNFKNGIIPGIILRVVLKKKYGDKSKILADAKIAHNLRLTTQPSPYNNLGSCFMSGNKKFHYRLIQFFARKLRFILPKKYRQIDIELFLLGHHDLTVYLFDMNRFIWKDNKSIQAFKQYVKLYKRMHTNAELEINIFH